MFRQGNGTVTNQSGFSSLALLMSGGPRLLLQRWTAPVLTKAKASTGPLIDTQKQDEMFWQ